MALNPKLLEVLVCPETKAKLLYDEPNNKLISTDPDSRRSYKIVDDIPIMLIDESEIMEKDSWKDAVSKLRN
ncbi:MAG: hypothetical protein DWQ06_12230 [Calditrichaeota bacterium]|nr:MAG: hypothetical protein DWQ06_12230 [Calditrichota bacterium]